MLTSFGDFMKGLIFGLILAIILLFLAKYGLIPIPLDIICSTPKAIP